MMGPQFSIISAQELFLSQGTPVCQSIVSNLTFVHRMGGALNLVILLGNTNYELSCFFK